MDKIIKICRQNKIKWSFKTPITHYERCIATEGTKESIYIHISCIILDFINVVTKLPKEYLVRL